MRRADAQQAGDVQLPVARATDSGRPSAAADPRHGRRCAVAALALVRRAQDGTTINRAGEAAGLFVASPIPGPETFNF